jgi:P-type Ca2+ transporter type 2B
MTVVQSFTCGRLFAGGEKGQPGPGQLPSGVAALLSQAIAANCAYNSAIVEPKRPGDRVQQLGNKTECGLLGWVRHIGGDYEQVRCEYPEESLHKGWPRVSQTNV